MLTATLKDIALKVERSITTVSRALAGYDDVSPQTKALVRQVAAELNYIPNISAQRLRKQHTQTLGLIFPTVNSHVIDPYFNKILVGISSKAVKYNYDLLVSICPSGDAELTAYEQLTRGRRVDGFIVVLTQNEDPRIIFLSEQGIPFVAFGRTSQPYDFPYVDEDGELGMQLVLEHLLGQGHRRIACLASPANLMMTTYRLQGFRQTLQASEQHLDEDLITYGDLTQRSGYHLTQKLLSQDNPPTAIVACNDLMALGAMSAAQEDGLIVGQDVSITGFGNIALTEHTFPPLTTVHQPIHHIGTLICQMLIKVIRDEALAERQIVVQPSLVVRQSSGPKT